MAHIVVWHFVHIVQTPSKFSHLLCALLLHSAEISDGDIQELPTRGGASALFVDKS